MKTIKLVILIGVLVFGAIPGAVQGQTATDERPESEQLLELQRNLADQYRLLEDKLFTLHEYERDNNPMRSRLLQRAFLQSQENMTLADLQRIVEALGSEKLKDAENGQTGVLKDLESLLKLLESEDRGKRVRDDIRRHQEYLKEVERLLRIQKGIRGQTENGGDPNRMANAQESASNRAKQLAEKIRKNEEEPEASDENEDPASNDKHASDENEAGDKDGSKENEDGKKSEKENPTDKESTDKQNDNSDSESENQPSESEGGEPSSQQGEGSPQDGGQSGQPGEGSPSDAPPEQNPVRQRLEAAQQRMEQAKQDLENAKQNESVEEMRAAEKELAAAKAALEEILRQLREEEVGRTLAMLEGRFRRMLERQVKVYDTTRKLNATPAEERGTEFEINAGKQSTEENSIATEASRALLLLREDGSSVAFPETVEQMQQDMLQVAQRLSAANVGQITIEIEEDIIETLDYIVKALVVTQQDLERMRQNGKPPGEGGGGMPGDQPLVDSLAEIKMLKGLQQRIYKRHTRYSKLLDDPNDPIGSTDNPEMKKALERLSERQRTLTNIARDIVAGKNK